MGEVPRLGGHLESPASLEAWGHCPGPGPWCPDIPTVVLTSSESERGKARAYGHHANRYVTKPVDFGKFGPLMEQLGRYWLSVNRG